MKFRELLYEDAVKGEETIKKPVNEEKVRIFDILGQLFSKSEKFPYDKQAKKAAPAYMLLWWISHERDLIRLANKLNKRLFNMSDEQVYKALVANIPEGRKRYIRWTKKNKQQTIQIDEAMEDMMAKYNLSKREATQIYYFKERLKNGS